MEKRRSRYGLTRIERKRKLRRKQKKILGAKKDFEEGSTGGVPSAAPRTSKDYKAREGNERAVLRGEA